MVLYNYRMRVLVTGASGQLGPYVIRRLVTNGQTVIAWGWSCTRSLFGETLWSVDLTDHGAAADAFTQAHPDVVVHAAAVSQVNQAYQDPERAQAVNVTATQLLVQLAAKQRARLIYLSTDMVFDGEHAPYSEQDPVQPVSVYGRTKLQAEQSALELDRSLILRLSLLFGPTLNDRPKFFDQIVKSLRKNQAMELFTDEWRSVLGLPEAAAAIAAAVGSEARGLLHLGGPQRLSRYELGINIANVLGLDSSLAKPASRLQMRGPEPRPRDLSLNSTRWLSTFSNVDRPDLQSSLRQMLVS